ncbi:hypothetical protein Taro_007781 [Colocasia esculenta]|uniref:Uncharacterized protein n=1 Tax=Colocasia esculenta TaxID=4460 RepID=A0A843U4X1_COLES|nr:hypothetical protein [Colocasia esculenta]
MASKQQQPAIVRPWLLESVPLLAVVLIAAHVLALVPTLSRTQPPLPARYEKSPGWLLRSNLRAGRPISYLVLLLASATTGDGMYVPSFSFDIDTSKGYTHSEGGHDSERHYGHHLGYGPYGGGQQETGMYEWGYQLEFQFQPFLASSSYSGLASSSNLEGSAYHADSEFQSSQQSYTLKRDPKRHVRFGCIIVWL